MMNSKEKLDDDEKETDSNTEFPDESGISDIEEIDLTDGEKDSIFLYTYLCYINKLPDELILRIFSYLSVVQICLHVKPVCKKWRRLSYDPVLYKSLDFSWTEYDQIEPILKNAIFLEDLTIVRCENISEILSLLIKNCNRLKELSIQFCGDIPHEDLYSLIEKYPDLTKLDLEACRVKSFDSKRPFSFSRFRKLQILNVCHCVWFDNKSLFEIANNCHSLQYVNIDGSSLIVDAPLIKLFVNSGSSLTNLLLDGENLSDESYKALKYCPNLVQLSISFSDTMTDVGLQGLVHLKKLKRLKIRKGGLLTSSGYRMLFKSIGTSGITHLNLSENSLIGDDAMEVISIACPKLRNVELQWCWELTDQGIIYIIDNCHEVRILDLTGVARLTENAFVNVVERLPELLVLDLEQCGLVDEGYLETLVAKKGSIKIYNYWGDEVISGIKVQQ